MYYVEFHWISGIFVGYPEMKFWMLCILGTELSDGRSSGKYGVTTGQTCEVSCTACGGFMGGGIIWKRWTEIR